MATRAAELARTASAEKLIGTMRQLRRYIDGGRSTERITKDKMSKVIADRDDLITAHHAYGAKASISIEDDEMRNFIDPKVDEAEDLLDEAEVLIDQLSAVQTTKDEQQEVDMCKATIDSTIVDLEQVILKVEAVEADALYVETTLKDLRITGEKFTKSCKKLADIFTDATQKTEIIDLDNATHTNIRDIVTKGRKFFTCVRAENRKVEEPKTEVKESSAGFRTQRTPLPTFSGNPRDFARFKADYEAIVTKAYPETAHRLYAIRSQCLQGVSQPLLGVGRAAYMRWSAASGPVQHRAARAARLVARLLQPRN